MRFYLFLVWRLIFLRKVLGVMYYLKEDKEKEFDKIKNKVNLRSNLDEDLWVREQSNYHSFVVCNIPYISQTDKPCPLSKCDDGYNDIFFSSDATRSSRCRIIKTFLKLEDGSHIQNGKALENQGYDYKKSKSWRFIPKASASESDDLTDYNFRSKLKIAIDGEAFPLQPIHGAVLPKAFTIFGYQK